MMLKLVHFVSGLIGKDGTMYKISLRKRSSTWEYRFQVHSTNGKQQYASKGGFRTKKAAADAGAIAQQEYETRGALPRNTAITYAKYLDFWLESYCRVNLKDTTCASYAKRIYFFLKPALGISDHLGRSFHRHFYRSVSLCTSAGTSFTTAAMT